MCSLQISFHICSQIKRSNKYKNNMSRSIVNIKIYLCSRFGRFVASIPRYSWYIVDPRPTVVTVVHLTGLTYAMKLSSINYGINHPLFRLYTHFHVAYLNFNVSIGIHVVHIWSYLLQIDVKSSAELPKPTKQIRTAPASTALCIIFLMSSAPILHTIWKVN